MIEVKVNCLLSWISLHVIDRVLRGRLSPGLVSTLSPETGGLGGHPRGQERDSYSNIKRGTGGVVVYV